MTEKPSGRNPASRPRPSGGLLDRAEMLALGGTIVVGLAAWGVGLRTSGYDYDEVLHAHSVWLASRGLRPYHDFLECHPPYFALLIPVVRMCSDPSQMLPALRWAGALGGLLFLGGLGALGMSLVATGKRWALLGLAVVAFQPAVLQFLIEFRIDGWGYALAVWSLYRFRRRSRGVYRFVELGVANGIATLLCPKLALLTPLFVLLESLETRESWHDVLRWGLSYLAGLGIAGVLIAVFLTAQGIGPGRTYDLVVRYNAIHNANSGLGHGLWRALGENRGLTLLIFAGVAGWTLEHLQGRSRPRPFEIALALWLAAQAFLVTYPYKQYYGPWYLFASFYLGFIGQRGSGRARSIKGGVFLAACGVTVFGAVEAAREWSRVDEAAAQRGLVRWMNRVTRPEDRVVALLPSHPIDRHDTFFVWFNTADPSGFDTERVLARLPTYRGYVSPERYRSELEAHPPALVVLSGDRRFVPPAVGQQEALELFLHARGYRVLRRGTTLFALRADRFEQATRAGLVD
ncbi:MAG: hypothetical protein NVSMB9_23470 [Isosphaeraceae bacterium]